MVQSCMKKKIRAYTGQGKNRYNTEDSLQRGSLVCARGIVSFDLRMQIYVFFLDQNFVTLPITCTMYHK